MWYVSRQGNINAFIFSLAGCPELTDKNGNFSFSNGLFVGSNATLTCDSNFEVSGSSPVTCMDSGWTGTPNCEHTGIIH